MKRHIFLLLALPLMLLVPCNTQAQVREQGLFIRPELYGAVAVELGYQLNPNIQISGGFGLDIDITGETGSVVELLLGVRAYASDTKWTAFFDYHLGFMMLEGLGLPVHRLTLGPSFKNFDFGGGLIYASYDGKSILGPCITIGYNFRVGRNR